MWEIVNKLVEKNWQAIKLFVKIIPYLKNCMSTSFGMSNKYCGGNDKNLAEIGKENKFLVDINKDASCMIIK